MLSMKHLYWLSRPEVIIYFTKIEVIDLFQVMLGYSPRIHIFPKQASICSKHQTPTLHLIFFTRSIFQ